MTITLADLKVRARNRADMAQGSFVGDSELTIYLQDSYAELYDLVVASWQDYFVADPVLFKITSGNSFTLQSDFYKLLGVDVCLSTTDVTALNQNDQEWYELKPFNFFDRNMQLNGSRFLNFGIYAALRYRVLGREMKITPTDIAANNTYRYWYIPTATPLVNDTDTLPLDLEKWSVYIETDAAIKMGQKEESDVSVLMGLKGEITARIKALAVNRDAGYPETVMDVRRGRSLGYGYGRF